MAWRGLLAKLHPPTDSDYVASFQSLSDIHLEIKRSGPTRELLIRKSILEGAIGNHGASRRTAQDAAIMADDDEALHRLGVTSLVMAYVEAGAMTTSPPEDDIGVRHLLREAKDAFERAVESNSEDPDSATLLAQVEQVLLKHPEDDEALEAELVSHMDGHVALRRPPRPRRSNS